MLYCISARICFPPKAMTSRCGTLYYALEYSQGRLKPSDEAAQSSFGRPHNKAFSHLCSQWQPNYPTVWWFWARWELVPGSSGCGSGRGSSGSNCVSTALAKSLLFLNLYAALSGVSWQVRNYSTWIEQKERKGFGILIIQSKELKLLLW